MAALKSIRIVGGGLAGLTLGIGLRQRGIPVTVWEAGHYPRAKVCGEFVSGRGQAVLEKFGLSELFLQSGAIFARTSAFFLGQARSPVRPLPKPALCLSRFAMDALLARHFREAGGELREGHRWREKDFGEGIVRASGRRLRPVVGGWRWFGLKVHAQNVSLEADLEMHGSPGGYVGLCRLNDGRVNICGLFRRPADAREPAPRWPDALRTGPDTLLRQRLAAAHFDEASFCAVAGLSLRPERACRRAECCIGDSLTMIAPATGNGMSMAFEAAELALAPLAAYSQGEASWEQARRAIATACDESFARRLAWAKVLQWLMFAPVLRGPIGAVALQSDWLWRKMFASTR